MRGLTQLAHRRLRRLATPESDRIAEAPVNAERSADNMAIMVDELLDLSRLESGRPLDLNRQRMDLVALVYQLAEEHQRGAPAHWITVEAKVTELSGFWDAVRIERVLANLVSNAIKYSPQGGNVVIGVSIESDETGDREWACVPIQDRGIGIPADELEPIFERFHRGSNVPQYIRGVGIGLAGARQIVRAARRNVARGERGGPGIHIYDAVADWQRFGRGGLDDACDHPRHRRR